MYQLSRVLTHAMNKARCIMRILYLSLLLILIHINVYCQNINYDSVINADNYFGNSIIYHNNKILLFNYYLHDSITRMNLLNADDQYQKLFESDKYSNIKYISMPQVFNINNHIYLTYNYPRIRVVPMYFGIYEPWLIKLNDNYEIQKELADTFSYLGSSDNYGSFIHNNSNIYYVFPCVISEGIKLSAFKYDLDLIRLDSLTFDTIPRSASNVVMYQINNLQDNNDKYYCSLYTYQKDKTSIDHILTYNSQFQRLLDLVLDKEDANNDLRSYTFCVDNDTIIYTKFLNSDVIDNKAVYSKVDLSGTHFLRKVVNVNNQEIRTYRKMINHNGNFYAIGHKTFKPPDNRRLYFIEKLDNNLDTVWHYAFKESDVQHSLSDIYIAENGTIYVLGDYEYKPYFAAIEEEINGVPNVVDNNNICLDYFDLSREIKATFPRLNERKSIEIYSLSGEMILREDVPTENLNYTYCLQTSLAQGCYIVKANCGMLSKVCKIIF